MSTTVQLGLVSALALAGACTHDDADGSAEISIACRLDALDARDRIREAALLEEHIAAVKHTRELADGYAFEFAPDPALFAHLAELVGLEHRCCPFLSFELEWNAGDKPPVLRITSSPKGKELVAEVFAARKS